MAEDRRDEATRIVTSTPGFTALKSGTRLDRYTIDSVIAAGGFGITYLAEHAALKKLYVLKEHFPRQFAYRDGATTDVRPSDDTTFRWTLDRFIKEGQSLARCRHPGVVGVADVFEQNGTAYMVLDYEDGQSLKSWLDGLGRPPTQAEVDRILAPLLDALEFVHDQGLLHRDIAPDNIMVRRDGKPCLIDFGAARQAVAERSQVMSAIVKGGFSPPEQYTSAGKSQGPWSDIYALAATLYRAVTGRMPPEATERQIDDEMKPLPESLGENHGYRPGFLAAIDAALRLRPAARPQSVAAWRTMLFSEKPLGTGSLGTDDGKTQLADGTTSGKDNVRQVTFADLKGGSSSTTMDGGGNRRIFAVLGAILLLAVGSYYLFFADTGAREREARAAIAKAEQDAKRIQAEAAQRAAEAERQRVEAQRAAEAQRNAEAERQRTSAEQQRVAAIEEEAARARAAAEAERQASDEARRRADQQRPGHIFRDCANCPEMVVVPAGSFLMGSPKDEAGRSDNEEPQHTVSLRRPFAVSRTHVTRGEYDAFVKATNTQTPNGCRVWRNAEWKQEADRSWRSPGFDQNDRHPVVCISWDDAKGYIQWLARTTGKPYRFLSESELEYVTRGATQPTAQPRFAFGTDEKQLCQYANIADETLKANTSKASTIACRDGFAFTAPAGNFRPNGFGLYDVVGNVWSWGEDTWHKDYAGAPANGSAWVEANDTSRIVRGGSWSHTASFLRAAARGGVASDTRYANFGLRIARPLD